jgi:crotonobetainyl-CoA:carnitine CoA-transferase CaiB-like acyl-CoA transferase
MADAETELRMRMATALGLDGTRPVLVSASATLDSAYPVSDLATASIATAAVAAAELCAALGFPRPEVAVDRGLADAWFGFALTPIGWTIPSPWDPIAGDYASLAGPSDGSASNRSGWIRLHTNAPRHRAAALRVLGVEAERQHVAAAVARWAADELEAAIVAEGGCAATLRSPEEWRAHPQGEAVAGEPLVALDDTDRDAVQSTWAPSPERPLAGLRVLDLTRVLAGPVATRLLAGLGADVLRIDPPDWDEPGVVPDMTIGKRAARLDAGSPADHERLLALLADADVLVHGYRPGALEHLGLGDAVRRSVRPGLIDVSLDAYGHTGPWAGRRGFDSLMQMSTGIAGSGLRRGTAQKPTPLPVQALDHGTGYLMAAAALTGLIRRVNGSHGMRARLSLARTAVELEDARHLTSQPVGTPAAYARIPLDTAWGSASLPPAPLSLTGVRVGWDLGPRPLGSDAPIW